MHSTLSLIPSLLSLLLYPTNINKKLQIPSETSSVTAKILIQRLTFLSAIYGPYFPLILLHIIGLVRANSSLAMYFYQKSTTITNVPPSKYWFTNTIPKKTKKGAKAFSLFQALTRASVVVMQYCVDTLSN